MTTGLAGGRVRRRAAEARAILGHVDLLRPRTFGYCGWAREGNLGDDLMLEAHRRLLAPWRVALLPRRRVGERLRVLASAPGGLRAQAMLLGGGTLFGRADWWRRVEPIVALLPDVPWMALGVGVEDDAFLASRPFTDRSAMRRWVDFASSWPVLGVRGPRSAEVLGSHGLAAEVTGDPALLLADRAQRVTARERLLGVSIAVPEARWGDAGHALSTMRGALAALRAAGWSFRFFVFSKWDADLTRRVCGELGERAELRRPATTAALVRDLGECHVLLGERLHSVVMAAAAGTPVVAAEYRPKLRDFMRSVEREEFALRVDRVTSAQVHEAVLTLAESRDAESDHLARAVDTLAARLRDAGRRACHAVAAPTASRA